MSGKRAEPGPGPCGWVGPQGEYCHNYGYIVKGLCTVHYSELTAKLRGQGLTRTGQVMSEPFCVCSEPRPELVRIWGSYQVAGALMCGRCGRCVRSLQVDV